MEFPHLGKHCNEATCNRLDFLPMKCDACDMVFCSSHFSYSRHACPSAYKKDIQIPICPLCGEPVPTAPGVEPDLTVGQHIDKQCKSDGKKIYTNRCNAKGCKRKELIPVTCSQCKLNFCLRHRHTADHECKAASVNNTNVASSSSSTSWQNIFKKPNENDARSMAAKAAENRRNSKITNFFNSNPRPRPVVANNQPQRVSTMQQVQNIQGNMSEEEALARALTLSMMELEQNADLERHNESNATTNNTAQQRSVAVGGRDGQQGNSKDKCALS